MYKKYWEGMHYVGEMYKKYWEGMHYVRGTPPPSLAEPPASSDSLRGERQGDPVLGTAHTSR